MHLSGHGNETSKHRQILPLHVLDTARMGGKEPKWEKWGLTAPENPIVDPKRVLESPRAFPAWLRHASVCVPTCVECVIANVNKGLKGEGERQPHLP